MPLFGRGVSVELDAPELASLAADLRRASRADRRRLTQALAAAGESAARERITAGGPGPDGERWAPRHPLNPSRKPLLNREGGLNDSIEGRGNASTARWGSNLVYARIHQLGGVIKPRRRRMLRFEVGGIPARPYIGWGDRERREADVVIQPLGSTRRSPGARHDGHGSPRRHQRRARAGGRRRGR